MYQSRSININLIIALFICITASGYSVGVEVESNSVGNIKFHEQCTKPINKLSNDIVVESGFTSAKQSMSSEVFSDCLTMISEELAFTEGFFSDTGGDSECLSGVAQIRASLSEIQSKVRDYIEISRQTSVDSDKVVATFSFVSAKILGIGEAASTNRLNTCALSSAALDI